MLTLGLAVPFIGLALIEAAYLIEYVRDLGGALTGVLDWRSVALEGSARWPEVAGMLIGQLLILSTLLIVRRHQPVSGPDLFGSDSAHSAAEQDDGDPLDPAKPV